jgi:hypothetical protein
MSLDRKKLDQTTNPSYTGIMDEDTGTNGIGTLNEKPLHAALKDWYARPGDRFEVPVDGFVADIVRGEQLIEIQTASFSAMKRKLRRLLPHHAVRLVYPIAHEKWIVKLPTGEKSRASRRKSPKRGSVEDLFSELVSFPHLLNDANFSLHVLLIQEEELRKHDQGRAWRRRGWVTEERRLLDVVGDQVFDSPADLAALLPADLPDPFTTADLARVLSKPRRLAQRMAYCLREMGAINPVGKKGRAILYKK